MGFSTNHANAFLKKKRNNLLYLNGSTCLLENTPNYKTVSICYKMQQLLQEVHAFF